MILDLAADLRGLLLQDMSQAHDFRPQRPVPDVHEADPHRETRPVLHDHRAVAVGDRTSRRHQLHRGQAVVVGSGQVLLTTQDLQEPEPEQDDAEEHDGDAGHDGDAESDGWQLDDGLVAAAGPDGPVAAAEVAI